MRSRFVRDVEKRDMRGWCSLIAVALSLSGNLSTGPALRAETVEEARAKALEVLKSDAPLEQKAAACRGLARFGDKDCVPVLAGMLGDEKLAHMARYALEPIPDKSVDEALRAALDRLDGKLLVGAIGSIGVRRDPAAVESLGKRLGSSVGDVVRTAAIALGQIGTAAAGKTLLEALKNATGDNVSWIGDGLLTCGANLAAAGRQGEAKELYDGLLARNPPVRIRAAALRGLVLCDRSNSAKLLTGMLHDRELGVFAMALRVAAEMKDEQVTGVLVSEVAKLPADRVVAVVGVLGQRADKSALPALLEMTKKGDRSVRVEAIRAAAEIGDASVFPVLVDLIEEMDVDAAVKREAIAGILSIAERRPKKQHAGATKAALEKVAKAASDDPAVRKRAEGLLKQIGEEN